MGRIMTLCRQCSETMKAGGMRTTQIKGTTTTHKKKTCENCGRKLGGFDLMQYIVEPKR